MNGTDKERAYRSNVVVTSLSEVLNLLVRTLASIVIARALGPIPRGEYALAMLIPGLFLSCTSLGLGEASAIMIGQKKYGVERIIGNLMTYNVLLSACLAAVYFGFTNVIIAFTRHNIHPHLYYLAYLLIPLTFFWGNNASVSLGLGQVKQVGYSRLLNNALYLAALLALYFSSMLTPFNALALFVITSVVEIFYLFYYLRQRARITFYFDPAILKEQTQFGIKFMLGGIFTQLNRRLNSYMVVFYLGNYGLGIFSVATGIADLLLTIPTVFARASFSLSARSENEEDHRIAASSVRQITFFMLVSAAGLALIAHPALILFYTRKFEDAFLPLLILLAGDIALGVGTVLGYVLVGRSRPQEATKAAGISCIFSVVFNILLVPKFKLAGAAFAATAASFVSCMYLVEVYRRMMGMSLKELLLVRRSDFVSYGGDVRRITKKFFRMADDQQA